MLDIPSLISIWERIQGEPILSQPIFYLKMAWDVLMNWWWLLLPLILLRPFLFLWRWWRLEAFLASFRFVVLEIKMPKEVLKPLKAMEQVFSAFWGCIYDPPDWWEKWIIGQVLLSFSLEMTSINGEPHFFIRVPERNKNAFEAAIYAQYPDAEISEVDDYTKNVPQDIPNKNWDMWASDYEMLKEDVYPIKTYAKFFEEKPEVAKEEKRLDPLSTLLEGMAKLGPGEQLWIQITAKPITLEEDNYVKRGRVIADKIARRTEKEKPKGWFGDLMVSLFGGFNFEKFRFEPVIPEEELRRQEIFPPEMKLTPGEREILAGLEEKIGKYMFVCFIRFIYLAKKEAYFGAARAIPFSFFQQFSTANLNALKPRKATLTKIHKHWFLPINLLYNRRLYIRKRRIFKNYIRRENPFFPFAGGTFLLNAEELATMFHLPGRGVAMAPFVSRVEAKKGEAPPGLPVE